MAYEILNETKPIKSQVVFAAIINVLSGLYLLLYSLSWLDISIVCLAIFVMYPLQMAIHIKPTLKHAIGVLIVSIIGTGIWLWMTKQISADLIDDLIAAIIWCVSAVMLGRDSYSLLPKSPSA